MTTTMHQSIAILQMSSIELTEFAETALNNNPFLEDGTISVENTHQKKREKLTEQRTKQRSGEDYSNRDLLANIAVEITLKDHITEQINVGIFGQRDKMIAVYLLDYLEPSGYIRVDIEEVARNLLCDYKMVETVLKKLQTFDPPGIFARSLRECLEIQAREYKLDDPSLIALINNIELLAKGDLKKLSKLCNVNINNLSSLIRQVKALNPKPGNGFLVDQTAYKIPDILLSFTQDGTVKLEISSESMPNLRVNNEYYLKIKDGLVSKEEKEFTKNEIESANTIVKSIEQRANTIIKVAKAIVEAQIEFFTRGIMYLKPLTLNKIAADTGFNESTISRSTANKYIAAPSGIYELKYFFSSSLSNVKSAGDDVSSTKAKEIIKQLIAAEDPENILSDDDISAQLSKFNISIARRTVAKYREAIGIPTSAERRRKRFISD